MAKILYLLIVATFTCLIVNAQAVKRELGAVRTSGIFKIDGNLSEPAWKTAPLATDFVEFRPVPGRKEDPVNKTEVYLLYDNSSIYIGGYCHERNADSISKELIGRDKIGSNDFLGVFFDTYNDKINASAFFVTPYGEQYDAKFVAQTQDNNGGEDGSWNSVWESAAKIQTDGWTFEMRIPYSALRFNTKDIQTWGLNVLRARKKSGQQLFWNFVDQNVSGLINQEGEWTGIQKIIPPLRLSLTPYVSTYLNHYPYNTPGVKDYSSSFNGGMDVKYGISQSFTLDMTLIPDFGQVQSDNQVLNLSPFEVKYNENRSFFTEGTELFNKGNLFYSRRIGGIPLNFGTVSSSLGANEHIVTNPTSVKLLNATKISGRTASGLGIGFFNAITQPMDAVVEDDNGQSRTLRTSPLTNYNIVVLDQNLKNHSSVTFINTNVLRADNDYNADVAGALFNVNNKKNTYNWNGKFAVSDLYNINGHSVTGYTHKLGFGKSSGRFTYSINQELVDDKYNPNDLGFLLYNNYINNYLYLGYQWTKPGKWYNNLYFNNNFNYNLNYNPSAFTNINYNVNLNGQLKNLAFFYGGLNVITRGRDYYEPHVAGRYFKSPASYTFQTMINTNQAKKYVFNGGFTIGLYDFYSGRNYDFYIGNYYRFSDKFSISLSTDVSPFYNNVGFVDMSGSDIIFDRRERLTIENIINAKYNFNNRSGITFRTRHYWSKVQPKEFFTLQEDGSLAKNTTYNNNQNQSFNAFTIDMVYTWQFGPGSFLNVVYKNAIYSSYNLIPLNYFKDFNTTMVEPQSNSISLKVIYYLDFLKFRKKSSY